MTSREVVEAVGVEGETLEQRRERLHKIVATPSERDIAARQLMEVETQIADRDRATLTAEAERRVVGIRRAYTGLAEQLDQDGAKVVEAADAYAAAVARMSARFLQLGALRAEYDGLAEGFALDAKPLPPVAILGTRREWIAASETVARAGVPDTNRTRLAEIPKSEGYALLRRAGKITT